MHDLIHCCIRLPALLVSLWSQSPPITLFICHHFAGATKIFVSGKHSCDATIDYGVKQGGLTRYQKEFVDVLLDSRNTPLQVQTTIVGLARANADVARKIRLYGNTGKLPDLAQIQKYSTARNKNQGGPAFLASLGRLKEKCKALTSPPIDDNEPFVIGFHFTNKDRFAVVVSSKKLLKKFSLTRRRAMDGTYKLLISGFPVLIYGVDDADGHFHPIAIALASNERGPDFNFVASSVEDHVPTTADSIVLMSDAAPAIRNGLRECMKGKSNKRQAAGEAEAGRPVRASTASSQAATDRNADDATGDVVGVSASAANGTTVDVASASASAADGATGDVGGTTDSTADADTDAVAMASRAVEVLSNMCWFHSKKASRSMARGQSKEKSGKLSSPDYWDTSTNVQRDLDFLHNMPYPFTDAFDYVLDLFYKKWAALDEKGFVDYHKKEWGGPDLRRWAVCHNEIGYPTTNNGLESNNRLIKLMAKHSRQYIDGFLEFMMIQVKIWSENSKDVIRPSTRPPLKAADWSNYEKYLRDRNTYGVLECEHDGICKCSKRFHSSYMCVFVLVALFTFLPHHLPSLATTSLFSVFDSAGEVEGGRP